MADNLKAYDVRFMEEMLGRLPSKIDVSLVSNDFNYVLDGSYDLRYLKYVEVNTEEMSGLIGMLERITPPQQHLIGVSLPISTTVLEEQSKDQQIRSMISQLHPFVAFDLLNEKDGLVGAVIDNPKGGFPYLFSGIAQLSSFLMSDSGDAEGMLLQKALFFPLSMDWFLIFDYDDLYALHFAGKKPVFKALKDNSFFITRRYSSEEIEDLKREAKN